MMRRLAWVETNHIVDDAFEQIFQLSRIVGVFPFSKQFKLSLWRLSIGISGMLLTGYHYADFVYLILTSLHTYSLKIFMVVSAFIEVIANFIYVVLLFKNLSQLRNLRNILNRTELIIRLNGISWTYESKWFVVYIKFLFFLLITIVESSLNAVNAIHFFKLALAYSFVMLYVFFILLQIQGLLSLLRSMMSQMKYIKDSSSLLKTHEILLSSIEIINDCYGPLLLLILAEIFLLTIRIVLRLCTDGIKFGFIVLALFNTALLIQLIFPIQRVIAEVKKINKLLYRRLQANPNDEMLQFHLLAKREVVFTACGFFNFENSVICTMIQTGTTYLVILLQYSQDLP